jgi:anti-anti-sigma regulatory factor
MKFHVKGKQMPLRITQQERSDDREAGSDQPGDLVTVLKVEGCLYLEDAELLERICRDIGNQTKGQLSLDLSDLCFLDSESASVLCRLRREQGVTLEGLHLFIAKVIELSEAETMVSQYLPKMDDKTEANSEKRPKVASLKT